MGRRRPPRDGTSTPTTRVQNTNSPTEEDPTRAGRGNDKDGFDHVGRHTGTTMGGRQARPTMDFRRHTTGGRRRLYRTSQDLTGRRPGQMDGARAQPDDRRSRPYPPGRPKPTQEYCIADGRGRRRYTHMGPGRGKTAEGVPSLSPQTHSVGGALRRMVSDGFHQKHLCFIMTTAEALLHNPHISPSQWATKAGHPKGRSCNNCSWGSRYHQALNSDAL